MALARITVLASGRGSNLAALVTAQQAHAAAGVVTHVVGNRPHAPALAFAQAQAIATTLVDHTAYAVRAHFDAALGDAIAASEPDLIVLAGFMRVLGTAFVQRFAGRMINIHPSLLPAYAGLHTHRRAIADGVREHGCTVHFVTAGVDQGAVIAQRRVPVLAGDDEVTLAARVLVAEHALLPAIVERCCRGEFAAMAAQVRAQAGDDAAIAAATQVAADAAARATGALPGGARAPT